MRFDTHDAFVIKRIERLVPCLFANQLHHFLCNFLGIHFSSLLRPIINSCKTSPVYREHCSSHGCDHRVTLRSAVFHGSNGVASHRRCRRVLPSRRCRGIPSSRHLPIATKRQSSCSLPVRGIHRVQSSPHPLNWAAPSETSRRRAPLRHNY